MLKEKSMSVLILMLVLVVAASGSAAELKGKTSVGVRFPVFIPLFEGHNFTTPTGNRQPFMMGWDFGLEVKHGISNRVMIGFNANYLSTYDDTTSADNSGDELNNSDNASAKLTGWALGLQGYWFYAPEWRFQPYILGGIGIDLWTIENLASDYVDWSDDFNFKVGTGLLFPVSDRFTFDAQMKLTYEVANNYEDVPAGFYGPSSWDKYEDRPFQGYLELSLGLAYMFGGAPDLDGDGVPDSKDRCPDTPAGSRVDENGCQLDSDGDGVPDELDMCRETPSGVPVDAKGCPLDHDGDGVPDYLDKCANTPKGKAVDDTGCPLDADGDGVANELDKCPDTPAGVDIDAYGCPLDSDGDGVANALDKCPDTPVGVNVDAKGCPLDSDGDGVLDYLDKCPGTPEGIPVDETGCPKLVKAGQKITLNINFPTDSYEIDEASKKILDGVAQTMQSFPEIKIRVGGFTDNTGSAGHNMTLSENRAKAVAAYLESKGVAANRMTAIGFGEDPRYFVADNDSEEGRAKNRRVELESVE